MEVNATVPILFDKKTETKTRTTHLTLQTVTHILDHVSHDVFQISCDTLKELVIATLLVMIQKLAPTFSIIELLLGSCQQFHVFDNKIVFQDHSAVLLVEFWQNMYNAVS